MQQPIQELIAAGQFLLQNNLTWGNAGNLSARLSPDTYLVTASGTHLGELTEADFVTCDLAGRALSPGKPSKETPMHQAIYATRPEVNAVVHASPFYATLAACSDIRLPDNWFVENMYYLERLVRVDYFHPGSQALGDAVRACAAQANLLLLENHGVLACDTSLREALMGLLTLEMVCRMAVIARSAAIEMKPLPPETVADFLANSGYRPRRQWSV